MTLREAIERPEPVQSDSAKRRVWHALQSDCPELAERMGEFARLGVAGVACGGAVWGRVDEQDREWVER